jgi:septum formation inhibitor-activating ATPase MinD
MKKISQTFTNTRIETVVWSLLGLCLVLLVLYVYFMNTSVFNVAKRVDTERQIAELTTNISHKEFDYISQTNKINIELAYALGFKTAEAPVYVSAPDITAFNTVR